MAILLEDGQEDQSWRAIDLDGTLAKILPGPYKSDKIGPPIPAMVKRLRRWVGHGKRVKIFTARADDEKAVNAIKKWLKDHELPDLEITNVKDQHCIRFYDDRAVGVEKNTGRLKESDEVISGMLGYVVQNEVKIRQTVFDEALLTESPEIKTLKDHAQTLTPEERAEVMAAKAVWHPGNLDKPTPAVRKSVVKGKTRYWCATHRCGQVRSTLKAAIKAFHDIVKETA